MVARPAVAARLAAVAAERAATDRAATAALVAHLTGQGPAVAAPVDRRGDTWRAVRAEAVARPLAAALALAAAERAALAHGAALADHLAAAAARRAA